MANSELPGAGSPMVSVKVWGLLPLASGSLIERKPRLSPNPALIVRAELLAGLLSTGSLTARNASVVAVVEPAPPEPSLSSRPRPTAPAALDCNVIAGSANRALIWARVPVTNQLVALLVASVAPPLWTPALRPARLALVTARVKAVVLPVSARSESATVIGVLPIRLCRVVATAWRRRPTVPPTAGAAGTPLNTAGSFTATTLIVVLPRFWLVPPVARSKLRAWLPLSWLAGVKLTKPLVCK